MAAQRLSTLQKAVLRWLAAEDQQLRGMVAAAHQDLVQTLEAIGFNKGNVSTSLKGLERKGLVTIARTPGGKAEAMDLIAEGRQRAARLTASCE
jgi:DNA-binding MarR family transcriptional regulator